MNGASIDSIVLLIEKFYSNSLDAGAIAQSQTQLQAIQKQSDALVLADELLDVSKGYPLACQFFGALTYTVQLNQLFAAWGRTVIKEEDLTDENETLKATNSDDDVDADGEDRDNREKLLVLNQILLRHLSHLTGLIALFFARKSNNLFVIRKVFSNLSLIYTYNFKNWINPILTLLQLLNTFQPLDDVSQLSLSITNLDDKVQELVQSVQLDCQPKISFMLLFSQIIIEDILKKNTISDKLEADLHRQLKNEVYVVTDFFINHLFKLRIDKLVSSESAEDVFLETMCDSVRCFSAWTSYISFSHLNSTERFDIDLTLKILIDFLLAHTASEQLEEDADLIAVVVDFLTSLVETNGNLVNTAFRQALNTLIFQAWGMNYLNYLGTDDEKAVQDFSRLIVAYLELEMVRMSTLLIKDDCSYIFETLIKLTNFPGVPIIDEEISRDFVEFWLETSDCLIDDTESLLILLKTPENLALFKSRFQRLLDQVSRVYWQKIQLPLANESNMKQIQQIDDEYSSYRRDVGDLFETMYPILKDTIFKTLITNIIDNVDAGAANQDTLSLKNVAEIEASLYLINAVMSNITEGNVTEDVTGDLISLFKNTKFLELSISSKNSYLMTATVKFLSGIDFFYKKEYGVEFLGSILGYLFNLLSITASNAAAFPKSFELLVAKSICLICDNCRTYLSEYLEKFGPVLVEVINTTDFDSFTREKVINSVSFVIQGIKQPELQGEYLSKVVGLLYNQSIKVFAELKVPGATADPERFNLMLEYLLSLLNSLCEVAKGMQLPDEASTFYSDAERKSMEAYWQTDTLNIRTTILSLISSFSLDSALTDIFISHYHNSNSAIKNMINYHNQITEKCCAVFRAGLCEDIAGPFVFSNEVIINYVTSKLDDITSRIHENPRLLSIQSMAITYLFGLLETEIACNYRTLSKELVAGCVIKVCVENSELIQQDVDLFTSSLQFITAIIERKPDLLLYINQMDSNIGSATDSATGSVVGAKYFNKILEACIAILKQLNEKFVIKCVVKFWSLLIVLKAGNKENHQYITDMFINGGLGQNLSSVAFSALLKATRSNVELYSDIIRNLIGKYPLQFKTWMETALMLISQQRVYAGKKQLPNIKLFIQKVYLTKGSRQTNTVIKDYWLAANGLMDFSAV